MSYVVFVGAITTTPMTTATQQTGGVPPGVVCYLNDTAVPEVWIVLALDSTDGSGCAIVEDGTGYYGSAVLPASVINAGFNIRIILFWVV